MVAKPTRGSFTVAVSASASVPSMTPVLRPGGAGATERGTALDPRKELDVAVVDTARESFLKIEVLSPISADPIAKVTVLARILFELLTSGSPNAITLRKRTVHQELYVKNGDAAPLELTVSGDLDLVTSGTFSPDGKKLYVANAHDNTVSVIDVPGRKEITRLKVGQVPKRNSTAILPSLPTTSN